MAEDDTGGGGLELPGPLGRRVGPLPLGVWLGAGAAGLVLAYVWNKRKGASEGTGSGDETTTDPSAADASASAFLPTGFVVGGGAQVPATGATGGSTTGDGVPSSDEPTGFQTNAQWRNAAVSALVARGYAGVVADDAIARYLESQSLNATQQGLVNLALTIVGPAPDPVPAAPSPPVDPTQPTSQPTPAAPAPAPAPSPAPVQLPASRFVIGENGGQVFEVVRRSLQEGGGGLRPITSEAELYRLGGGGRVTLAGGIVHTYHGNPNGTPPVPYPVEYLNSLPRV